MMIVKMLNNEVDLVRVRISLDYLIINFEFFLADVPQKRVDRHRSNGTNYGQSPNPQRAGLVGQLAEGSPLVSRRPLYSNIK